MKLIPKFLITSFTGGSIVEVNASVDLAIDVNNLEKEMAEHPGMYAYYASLLAGERRTLRRRKTVLEAAKASAMTRIAAGKKYVVDAAVKRDAQVLTAQRRVDDTEARVDVLDAVVDAFRHRKDLLQSIGRNRKINEESERELTGRSNRWG